jgi:hypothetical protein
MKKGGEMDRRFHYLALLVALALALGLILSCSGGDDDSGDDDAG